MAEVAGRATVVGRNRCRRCRLVRRGVCSTLLIALIRLSLLGMTLIGMLLISRVIMTFEAAVGRSSVALRLATALGCAVARSTTTTTTAAATTTTSSGPLAIA